MLRYLFPRLTDGAKRGEALFAAVVAEARRPHWFSSGEVPDTLDGRFAVLATVCALVIVRLESQAEDGSASAALTERFIESMDAEHRQLGLNDPGLGRRVRKLLAAMGRRVEEWRSATAGERDWNATVASSLYRSEAPADVALEHSAGALRELWQRLCSAGQPELLEGKF